MRTFMFKLKLSQQLRIYFSVKEINLAVQFREGQSNDFYWEGATDHHLALKFNQEKIIKLKLMVLRAGLFNIARNIKYNIMVSKVHTYAINHSDYQNIYLEVKDSGKIVPFDFFQGITTSAFKKPQELQQPVQAESLI